jgi:hypothetical protein
MARKGTPGRPLSKDSSSSASYISATMSGLRQSPPHPPHRTIGVPSAPSNRYRGRTSIPADHRVATREVREYMASKLAGSSTSRVRVKDEGRRVRGCVDRLADQLLLFIFFSPLLSLLIGWTDYIRWLPYLTCTQYPCFSAGPDDVHPWRLCLWLH